MASERRTGFLAEAGHDVQCARRESGLDRELSKLEADEAGLLGGLQHHGIAHRERRSERAPEHLRRIVPRGDVGRHAQGFAHDRHVVVVQIRDHLAVNLVGRARIELEIARDRAHVGARLGDRLAGVMGLDPRQPLGMRKNEVRKLRHEAAALGSRGPAPFAIQRRAGCRHGRIDLGAIATGEPGKAFPRCGCAHRHRRAAPGNPLVADEMPIHRRRFAAADGGGVELGVVEMHWAMPSGSAVVKARQAADRRDSSIRRRRRPWEFEQTGLVKFRTVPHSSSSVRAQLRSNARRAQAALCDPVR